jgi:DNA-binding transcriptional regulator YiaG
MLHRESRQDDARWLRASLRVLGWSGAELARRIDVHGNTVSAWRTGRRALPGAVRAYVGLALQVSALGDSLGPKRGN